MKIYTAFIGLLMICLMVGAVSAAGGASTSTSTSSVSASTTTLSAEQALSQVFVSSVSVDPQELYPGEQGIITVQLTNTGTQDVPFEHADILNSQNVFIPDETLNPYQVMTYLGPSNTMTYTFQVVAKPPDGIYYPEFSVSSPGTNSIIYPIEVQVSSTPIEEAISLRPDNFALNSTDMVNLTITNPRVGAISNIIVTPTGSGFGISPRQSFVASIPGGSSVDVPFAITPYTAGSTVNFGIAYSNGQIIKNPHEDTVSLPLNIGSSKTAASTVVNDLALTVVNGAYQLTGDVTNTGITDANGLVVSVGAPGTPVEPYSSYAVGSLTSNDFSSFTLTFTSSDLSAIPIETQWKDDNGNTLSSVQTFDLRSLASGLATGTRSGSSIGSGSGTTGTTGASAAAGGYGGARGGGGLLGFGGGRGGGLSAFYPVIIGGIVFIVAVILYVKRKWILGKIRKQ